MEAWGTWRGKSGVLTLSAAAWSGISRISTGKNRNEEQAKSQEGTEV